MRREKSDALEVAALSAFTAADQIGPLVVLRADNWPSGPLGAVAGRLAEHTGNTVAIFRSVPDTSLLSATIRSNAAVDVAGALATVQDLLETYGGHRAAGACTLHADTMPLLSKRFAAALAQQLEAGGCADATDHLSVVSVSWSALLRDSVTSDGIAGQIERLAPFGPGNPPPILVSGPLQVERVEPPTARSQSWRLVLADAAGARSQARCFDRDTLATALQAAESQTSVDAAYTVKLVQLRGEIHLSLTVVDIRPAGTA